MSKGGGSTRTITQTTAAPEYAKPFLEYGLSEAKQLYESALPQYYPGETTVGFAPESELALAAVRERALTGSQFTPAVQDVVMQNLMGVNPLQAAAFRPVVEQVQAQAARAGRYGSGYQQAALAQALAPYAYQAQQAAIQQAPAVAELDYAGAQRLAQVGAAREAQAQAELAADIQRFQFEQARPQQKLAEYLTSVRGGTMGQQTMTPQFSQPALGFLSGGLAGASAANLLKMTGPSAYPLMAGGAILGLMGS